MCWQHYYFSSSSSFCFFRKHIKMHETNQMEKRVYIVHVSRSTVIRFLILHFEYKMFFECTLCVLCVLCVTLYSISIIMFHFFFQLLFLCSLFLSSFRYHIIIIGIDMNFVVVFSNSNFKTEGTEETEETEIFAEKNA